MSILPNERHLCPIGGLDANVMTELQFHKGEDTYAQCVKDLIVVIGCINTAYSIKGGDGLLLYYPTASQISLTAG